MVLIPLGARDVGAQERILTFFPTVWLLSLVLSRIVLFMCQYIEAMLDEKAFHCIRIPHKQVLLYNTGIFYDFIGSPYIETCEHILIKHS